MRPSNKLSTPLKLSKKYLSRLYRVQLLVFWSPERALRFARWLGVEVGEGTILYSVSFGSEPWLVKIGKNTLITKGTQFITHDGSIIVVRHGPFGINNPDQLNRYGKFFVGDNCFVGINSIIMPNVVIGDNCIVGAGSVVTKSVPENTVVAGNPARIICNVADFAEKVKKESLELPSVWPDMETKQKFIRGLLIPDDNKNA